MIEVTLRVQLDLSPAMAAVIDRLLGAGATAAPPSAAEAVREDSARVPASAAFSEVAGCTIENGPAGAAPQVFELADRTGVLVSASSIAEEPKARADEATAPEKRWTADRIALLRQGYADGCSRADLLSALNAMPGAPLTKELLHGYIAGMGLRRSKPEAPISVDPPPAPIATPSPAVSALLAGEQLTDDATIRRWAAERGVCNGGETLDLDRINSKRRVLGLPPFARRNGLSASAATMRPGAGDRA